MLKKVLSAQTCANCRFCCSFRRQSLWELEKLPLEFAEKHKTGFEGEPVRYTTGECNGMEYALIELRDRYLTDDPEEEVKCPFLDPHAGCILPDEEKPIECRMWPLRYMKMPDGTCEVALSPACPKISEEDKEKLAQLVNDGLREQIVSCAEEYPFIVMDYVEGYEILK